MASQGINLSGHKLSAVNFSENDYKEHLESTLNKNITFFENNPIELLMNIINSRGYNNPTGEFNDIMIVSIPKEELKQNKEGIIIETNQEKHLNPSYIQGFVRMNVKDGNVEKIFDNPIFQNKDMQKDSVELMNADDWKIKFEQWYEKSRTTKMQSMQTNIIGFFKKMLNREKNKENDQELEM